MDDRMDLAYRVLDDQIVDVDGRRCGRVDDVEFAGEVGGELLLAGLLTGRGTYARRLPRRLRRYGEKLFGRDVRGRTVHRIPWEDVEDVTARIALYRKADDLDLGQLDGILGKLFERLPRGS